MTYVTTPAKIAKHKKTDHDIYFDNLEEAYGNLPVPNDDWAGITELLESKGIEFDKDKLEEATEVIRRHYDDVAKALGKEQKYG